MFYENYFESPIGTLGVQWESKLQKVNRITLPNEINSNTDSETKEKKDHLPSWVEDFIQELKSYFFGHTPNFLLERLNYENFTGFQLKVHKHVFQIPIGKTKTYSEVANEVGSPNAARAVGNVMAQNPYPIMVPCHRVIAQNGGLGGYRGGLDTKIFLLSLEQQRSHFSVSA